MSFLIKESPKFYINNDQCEKGFNILKDLLNEDINEETREIIVKQTNNLKFVHTSDKFSRYSNLFSPEKFALSIMIFVLFYSGSHVYHGLIYSLPIILQKFHNSKGKGGSKIDIKPSNMLTAEQYDVIISDILMTCFFEVPSDISNGFTPNIPWLGRKGAIIVGFMFSSIFCLFCIIHSDFMPFYTCLLRFFINIPYNVLYTYASEAYPTYMRSTAVGISIFFSRVGGFTTPFICDFLFDKNPMYPFLGFFTFSSIGFFVSVSLPFDTLDRTTY